jgi:hypothetical protein
VEQVSQPPVSQPLLQPVLHPPPPEPIIGVMQPMLDKAVSNSMHMPNRFATTRFIPTPCLPQRVPARIADALDYLSIASVSFRDIELEVPIHFWLTSC